MFVKSPNIKLWGNTSCHAINSAEVRATFKGHVCIISFTIMSLIKEKN